MGAVGCTAAVCVCDGVEMKTQTWLVNANSIKTPLRARSVHMIANSPPYWALRDYQTGRWVGGDPECQHTVGNQVADSKAPGAIVTGVRPGVNGRVCKKCGAVREDAQIGLEPLHDCLAWARGEEPCGGCFVCSLRVVGREAWRVLRDDGTWWLNLGDSMSSGKGANILDCLNRIIEHDCIFLIYPLAVAVPSHSVNITSDDQAPPNGVFSSLFASQWESIEQGNKNFGEVLHFFANPSDGRIGVPIGREVGDISGSEMILNQMDHISIVSTNLNSQRQTILGILRSARTGAGKDDKASLSVNQPDKPSVCNVVVWHSRWDSISINAIGKGVPNVNPMDYSIPLTNCPDSFACSLSDLRVIKASQEEIVFRSKMGGFEFVVSNVRHLFFSRKDGGIIPYASVYKQASAQSNMAQQKQEIGVPDSVKKALQADGWICRNTIIWHKPNPLPESVSDRCTKAHEYIFLLTKSPRYYFDNHAIREPLAAGTFERTLRGVGDGHKWTDGAPGSTKHSLSQARPNRKHTNGSMGGGGSHLQGHSGYYKANGEPFAHPDGRNKRTIWTVPTQSYPGSHFATWPEALVEPMIKAGTSEYGVCPTCGAPWQRVVDKGEAMQRWDNPNPVRPYDADSGFKNGAGGSTLHMTRPSSTAGWEPGCDCGGELEPVPAVVLDLFAGSGTTGVVSRRLGRNFIGLDLSFEYLKNEARGRLALDALAAWESGAGMQARPNGKAKKQTAGQLALLVE